MTMNETPSFDHAKFAEVGLQLREAQREDDRKLIALSIVAPEMLSEEDHAHVAALSITDPALYREFGLTPEGVED